MTYHIYSDSDKDNITGAANEGGELNNCQGLDLGKIGRRGGGESIWPLPRFCRSQFSVFIKYEDVWEPNKYQKEKHRLKIERDLWLLWQQQNMMKIVK